MNGWLACWHMDRTRCKACWVFQSSDTKSLHNIFEWLKTSMTYHVVDVRVLQRVVKTPISWTRICAIDSKLPLLLLTHLGLIITKSVHKLFMIVSGRTVYMHDVLMLDTAMLEYCYFFWRPIAPWSNALTTELHFSLMTLALISFTFFLLIFFFYY